MTKHLRLLRKPQPKKNPYGTRIVEVAKLANELRAAGTPREEALRLAEQTIPKVRYQC